MADRKFKDIKAVILSGGKSSRMKQDKSLMSFGDCDTMLMHQYNKLSDIFEDVYISAKEKKSDFIDPGHLILDNNATYSPMIALKSIFETLNDTPRIFIITVDMPLVEKDSIIRLVKDSLLCKEPILVAKDSKDNRHTLCGVFKNTVLKDIERSLSDDIHKINHLLKSSGFKELKFENSDEFLNLNTPLEYDKALKLL